MSVFFFFFFFFIIPLDIKSYEFACELLTETTGSSFFRGNAHEYFTIYGRISFACEF